MTLSVLGLTRNVARKRGPTGGTSKHKIALLGQIPKALQEPILRSLLAPYDIDWQLVLDGRYPFLRKFLEKFVEPFSKEELDRYGAGALSFLKSDAKDELSKTQFHLLFKPGYNYELHKALEEVSAERVAGEHKLLPWPGYRFEDENDEQARKLELFLERFFNFEDSGGVSKTDDGKEVTNARGHMSSPKEAYDMYKIIKKAADDVGLDLGDYSVPEPPASGVDADPAGPQDPEAPSSGGPAAGVHAGANQGAALAAAGGAEGDDGQDGTGGSPPGGGLPAPRSGAGSGGNGEDGDAPASPGATPGGAGPAEPAETPSLPAPISDEKDDLEICFDVMAAFRTLAAENADVDLFRKAVFGDLIAQGRPVFHEFPGTTFPAQNDLPPGYDKQSSTKDNEVLKAVEDFRRRFDARNKTWDYHGAVERGLVELAARAKERLGKCWV
ncbi:unnamed protein product [Pedinophyceae sp. YPF-701]|nr:unnamed protein product [Pedinophyceae sp. YPF-701]